MRVLVVEDETVLADAIAHGLRREGMAVDVALDGGGALDRLEVNRYDVVVLDRDRPAVQDDVCRSVAERETAPRVIMLTASGEAAERVEGRSLDADDYLPKPFAFAELVARVRALARRTRPSVPPVLAARGITVDPARRIATRNGRYVRLTDKELAVLEVLLAAKGRVVSAEELLARVWDEHADPFTNRVRVTLMRLRKKLGRPPVIETLAGAGYRL